ncbi:hypothetical protein FRC01_005900 [Tulasnella sp. 417]|nr:hypothetical protein FRC01_005900 [Tulasnella sp. 417]
MDQNYFSHHFAHPHHHHSSSAQYLDQQQQFACQPQEFYIPPPQTGGGQHSVVCDATFAEAQQQQHQAFITSSHLDPFANAEEGGPIGWVPPEERGFQHQPASNAIGSTRNEVSVGYPTLDHQPQFAPTPFHESPTTSATSNWSPQQPQQVQVQQQQQQPQPATNLAIYQMAGEAVDFHHHTHPHTRVQVPQDLSSNVIPGQPQSTGVIPNVPISMLAPQAVYPSTLLDPASTSPSVSFQQQQQAASVSVGGAGTQGYPQPAVAQGYNDVQVQHQPHSHEVTSGPASHPVYSTSSAAPSTGILIPPAANPGVASPSSPPSSASSSESLYPGMYPQTACGSSESMAILNGAIPHHQQQAQIPHPQQLYSASGSYEAQSQYLAHHPQPSARAQTFHSGLSDSNVASNFITSPTTTASPAAAAPASANPTHGAVRVVVQQPQPLAPSRTSSLAAWADVPPPPIVNPEHAAPVLAPGVQEYHYHHQQYHQQQTPHVVKEEQGVQFQQPIGYSPVQLHQPQQLKIEDVKPQLHQAALVLRRGRPSSSGSAAAATFTFSHHARYVCVPANCQQHAGPANGNTAALAPTRSVAEFDVAPRPVEAIKASETVRQAAKLHIDVGQADPNSPTSHEARLKARSLRRKGSAAPQPPSQQHGYSPYQRDGAPATAQHQTIEFSGGAESSMSPEELGKGKALDRASSSAADSAALLMGEKKPFLACGFCRQRKIACGQRAPHPRDNEIGEGPRTCNQCARRHILCSFPSESRRGLRKTKPVTKTIVQEDGTEVTIVIEDEEEIEELEQASSKKQSKSKKKGRGPMEWIIAADAWLITPTAWAAHKAALEKKAAEGNGSMPGSSGLQELSVQF